MAMQMDNDTRIQMLRDYNPYQHIVQVKTKQGMKDYYPACWRLYELNLRYPNANFSSELVFFDIEHDLCIVKARLYLGASYEQSDKKAEAMKSGRLSDLDKVETAAKARAARDFGISTETALDMEPDEEEHPASHANSQRSLPERSVVRSQPQQAVQSNGVRQFQSGLQLNHNPI